MSYDEDEVRRRWAARQAEGLPLFGFDAGMAASQRSAAAKWTVAQQHAVDAAISWCAGRYPGGFTTDEVWGRLGEEFPVSKGMAARLNVATRRGVIVNTGLLASCARGNGHDHGQRLTIWRAAAVSIDAGVDAS